MLFIANLAVIPKFYKADKSLTSVTAIEWVTELKDETDNTIWKGSPTIKDNQQAIHALHGCGVKRYKIKDDAKALAKTHETKTWTYCNLRELNETVRINKKTPRNR